MYYYLIILKNLYILFSNIDIYIYILLKQTFVFHKYKYNKYTLITIYLFKMYHIIIIYLFLIYKSTIIIITKTILVYIL